MTEDIFEKIILKKIDINKNIDTYFVFDNENNIIEVEASNALEAIAKSKVQDPVKVRNISSMTNSSGILSDSLLKETKS